MRSAETLRARLVGGLALDRNPLRRMSDRVESWFVLALIVAYVPLAVLATVSAASWVQASGVRELTSGASLRPATATLTRAVPQVAAPVPGSALVWAPAQWNADGVRHTGEVPAAPGSKALSTVSIWVDRAGNVEPPPLTRSQLSGRVTLAATTTPLALALGLWVLRRGLRWLLDRRRLASWGQAWSLVGPLWTR